MRVSGGVSDRGRRAGAERRTVHLADDQTYEMKESIGGLLRGLDALARNQRGSIILDYYAGYSYKESAAILGSTASAVEPCCGGCPALPVLQLRSAAQEPQEPLPAHPAMAAGVADHVWTLDEIAGLLDQRARPSRRPSITASTPAASVPKL